MKNTMATPGAIFLSRLPAELEREIFDIAVLAFPKCVPEIILVARRFHIWYEPELYRIMRSGEGRVIPPLYLAGPTEDEANEPNLDMPRLKRYGTHVRHVLLQKRTSEEIKRVLECCPNVSNLALWIIRGTCSELVPILERLPLRRFSFDPSFFFENYAPDMSIPLDQPLFHRLTHLEIINATSSWSKWKQLTLLPRLSHLALAGIVTQQLIDRVLSECRSLELFVLFDMHHDFRLQDGQVASPSPQREHRVVFLKSVIDHLDHWERGARGEEDFWIKAERRKRESVEGGLRRSAPVGHRKAILGAIIAE